MKFWSRTADIAPLIDVHENRLSPLTEMFLRDAGAAVTRTVRLPESATHRNPRPPQDLRKAYGRASRTIHQLRGEAALLREEIDGLNEAVSEGEEVVAELQAALDTSRPAPDPAVLGEQLKKVWFRPRPGFLNTESAWQEVAETAIDAVRGLWPVPTPGERIEILPDETMRFYPRAEQEGDSHEADRRLADLAYSARVGDRDPNPAARRVADRGVCAAQNSDDHLRCTRPWGHTGQHVGGNGITVLSVWPNEPAPTDVAGGSEAADTPAAAPWAGEPPAPGDTDDVVDAVIHNSWCDGTSPCDCEIRYLADALVEAWREPQGREGSMNAAWRAVEIVRALRIGEPAADTAAPGDTLTEQAETHLEQLAQVIASADLDLHDERWATTNDGLRAYYRGRADAVVLAGWRPPLGVDQRPVVAQVLTDHELLADDTCRCGWGDGRQHPGSGGSVVFHAEHVAAQLVGTGAIA